MLPFVSAGGDGERLQTVDSKVTQVWKRGCNHQSVRIILWMAALWDIEEITASVGCQNQ